MGCGCGRNANRNTGSKPAVVPAVSQTKINGNIVSTQSLNPRPANNSPAGLSLDKRQVEKIRQEAIRKALGK